ncbi:metallophosphoesterase family protein [Crossiella sp. CA198]|uniref:metallophosphoesterase family protein n=1 Tax=Crossiella sp. CA198 TaxID=3455607 RepID=UPI003F8D102F
MSSPQLLATSDLHCDRAANREVVAAIRPESDQDWLIVAGDVSDTVADVDWALRTLRERFAKLIWVPGNHELWTVPKDEVRLRGEARYRHLVELCRSLDVVTPEDEFPVWHGEQEDLVIAPLFLLYDYSIGRRPGETKEQALARAREAGVVGTDEVLLHHDPYPSRDAWCHARVEYSQKRLDAIPADRRTVLVNHFPLHPGPTKRLHYQDFALWCGTTLTEDWHLRYRAAVVVSGHLHIPLTDKFDGVRFEEVSLGYPREWQPRKTRRPLLRPVLIDSEPQHPLPS